MIFRAGLIALCILGTIAGGARTQDVPNATDGFGGFALQDASGTRLLLIPALEHPERLHTALCSGGHRVPVQFEGAQAARQDSNHRQASYNFDNLAGTVFRVGTGRVDSGATCFLASEPLLVGTTLLRTAAPEGPGACVQRVRFATLRDRPVAHCWPIATLGRGKAIALLEFARRGKDALASLVLVDGARTMFADYSAEFRREGDDLWRVDDEGVLSPAGFEIVCALQRDGWYALGVSWSGSEGRSLSLWIADSTERFTQVLNDHWYQAPT